MTASRSWRGARRTPAQRFPESLSTEDFLRTVVFAKPGRDAPQAAAQAATQTATGLHGNGRTATAPPPAQAGTGQHAGSGQYAGTAPQGRSVVPSASRESGGSGGSGNGTRRVPGVPGAAPESPGQQSPALHCACTFAHNGKLSAKQERIGGRVASYQYTHDATGHLTEVRRDGATTERYTYNAAGQRVAAWLAPVPGMPRDALREFRNRLQERAFSYDAQGRLIRAGGVRHMYAPDGSLRCREEGRASTWFYYGNGEAGEAPKREGETGSWAASAGEYRSGGGHGAASAPFDMPGSHGLPEQQTLPGQTMQPDARAHLTPVALDSVVLPTGDIIRYRFGQNGMPFLVLRNDAPSEQYQWLDPLRLARFRDHRTGADLTFHYGVDRVPEAVTVRGPVLDLPDLADLLDLPGPLDMHAQRDTHVTQNRTLLDSAAFEREKNGGRGDAGGNGHNERNGHDGRTHHNAPDTRQHSVTLRIGRDQVGTVKALVAPDGRVVKRMEYDSFGNLLLDTCPYFFLPLGFAGGLADRHIGLVRFGFRDYDPRTGRFTAPDPLGDTGGDHDLYDYCVDDPVSAFDPLGLIGESIAGRIWDESRHPRDPIGRFTFSQGTNSSKSTLESNNSNQPVAGVTPPSQSNNNMNTQSDNILQQLRPWITYPYDSPEKQNGIGKIQTTLRPSLQEWGKNMFGLGLDSPNGIQIGTELIINKTRNEIKSKNKNPH